jgi:hypothetical protein
MNPAKIAATTATLMRTKNPRITSLRSVSPCDISNRLPTETTETIIGVNCC